MKTRAIIERAIASKIAEKEKDLINNIQNLARQLNSSLASLKKGEGNYALKTLMYTFQPKVSEIGHSMAEIVELRDIETLLTKEITDNEEALGKKKRDGVHNPSGATSS